MFGRRRAPPPPPLPAPAQPYPILVLGMFAGWLLFLVLAKQQRALPRPHQLKRLWMCWPMTLGAFLTAQHDVLGHFNLRGGHDLNDPVQALVYLVPIVGFALLFTSEMVTWIFALLANPPPAFAALRHPVMSVHAMSLLYYIFEPITETCVRFDAFGRPLHPLRYVMWTISVSTMCLALYVVVEHLLRNSKFQRSLSEVELRDMFIDALIGCYFTFTLGYLGSHLIMSESRVLNYGCFFAASAAFYLMLARLTSMLTHVSRERRIVQTGFAVQFKVVRAAVVVAWNIFPCVWLLGATNTISVFHEHIGYVIGDVCAKYLLLFVYVQSING